MRGRVRLTRSSVVAALVVSLSVPQATFAKRATDHVVDPSLPQEQGYTAPLATCLSESAKTAVWKLFSKSKPEEKKTGDQVIKLLTSIAGQSPGVFQNNELKDLIAIAKKHNIPMAVFSGILSSPEMGLDEGQKRALAEIPAVPLDEILKSALRVDSEEGDEALKVVTDLVRLVETSEDETKLSGAIVNLVAYANWRDLPLGVLPLALQAKDVKVRLSFRARQILDEKIANAAQTNLGVGMKKNLARFAPHLDITKSEDFLKDLVTLQSIDLRVYGGREKLEPVIKRIEKFAREQGLSYVLPSLLSLDINEGVKRKGPATYCLMNGNSASEKRDALYTALNNWKKKDLKALGEELALGESEKALENPVFLNALSTLQDKDATQDQLREALAHVFDALKTDGVGISDLPEMLRFLKKVPGLKLSEQREKVISDLMKQTALVEAGAGLNLSSLDATERARVQGLIEKLKGEKDIKKIPGLVNEILDASLENDIFEQAVKFLRSGTITMDPDKARSIRQTVALGTMDPAIRLAKDGLPVINNSTWLGYLGESDSMGPTWKSSAEGLARLLVDKPAAKAALQHLIKEGYFTPRQAEHMKIALATVKKPVKVAERKPMERETPAETKPTVEEKPKAVAETTFLKEAANLYKQFRKDPQTLQRIVEGKAGSLSESERQGLKEYISVQKMQGHEIVAALNKTEGVSDFSRTAMTARLAAELKRNKLSTLGKKPEDMQDLISDMGAVASHTDVAGDTAGFVKKAEKLFARAEKVEGGKAALVAMMTSNRGAFKMNLSPEQREALKALMVTDKPKPTMMGDHGPDKPTEEKPPTTPAPEKLLADAVGRCATCHAPGKTEPPFDPAKPDGVVEALKKNSNGEDPMELFERMVADNAKAKKGMTDEEHKALQAYIKAKLAPSTAETKPAETKPEMPPPMTPPPPVDDPEAADKTLAHMGAQNCMTCHRPGQQEPFAGNTEEEIIASVRNRINNAIGGPEAKWTKMLAFALRKAQEKPNFNQGEFNKHMAELKKYIDFGKIKQPRTAQPAPNTPTPMAGDTKGTVFDPPAKDNTLAWTLEPGLLRLIQAAETTPNLTRARDVLHWLVKRLKTSTLGQNSEQELRAVLSTGGPEIRTLLPAYLQLAKDSLPAGNPRIAEIDKLLAFLKAQTAALGPDVYDRARVTRSTGDNRIEIPHYKDDNDQGGNQQEVGLGGREFPDSMGGMKPATSIGVPVDGAGNPIVPPLSIVLAPGQYQGRAGRYYYPTDAQGNVIKNNGPILSGESFTGDLIGLDRNQRYAFTREGNTTRLQRSGQQPTGRLAQISQARGTDARFSPAPVLYDKRVRSDNPIVHVAAYATQVKARLQLTDQNFPLSEAMRGNYMKVDQVENTFTVISEGTDSAFIQSFIGDNLKVERYKILPPANWAPAGMTVPQGAKHFVNGANVRTWALEGPGGKIVLYTEGTNPNSFVPRNTDIAAADLAKLKAFVAGQGATITPPTMMPVTETPMMPAGGTPPKSSDQAALDALTGGTSTPAGTTTPATTTSTPGSTDLAALQVLASAGVAPATMATLPVVEKKAEVVVAPKKAAVVKKPAVVRNPAVIVRQPAQVVFRQPFRSSGMVRQRFSRRPIFGRFRSRWGRWR